MNPVNTITEPALLRLLQLASASLPVGGFAYSQGLEYAVEAGWLADEDAVDDWLGVQLSHALAQLDLPVVKRIHAALARGDVGAVAHWNDRLLATRETRELRLTDTAMGAALQRLMRSLELPAPVAAGEAVSWVTAFTAAGWQWQLGARDCALALAWSWLENQIAAATKLVPLGQTQAQRLLGKLQQDIPPALARAWSLEDEALGAGLPGLALASSQHETQYSRLFRS